MRRWKAVHRQLLLLVNGSYIPLCIFQTTMTKEVGNSLDRCASFKNIGGEGVPTTMPSDMLCYPRVLAPPFEAMVAALM